MLPLLCLDIPPLGTYKHLSSFEMENRTALPKTHYYSFGLSATREQVNKVYNPNESSPRSSEARKIPGPGEYKYKNFATGTGGRHFSFLKRTRNSQGKLSVQFLRRQLLQSGLSQSPIVTSSAITPPHSQREHKKPRCGIESVLP